ncbi:uncharacterized protein F4822DRAFT_406953 [Hypoxylon trugodes]|uniref:uncharacterized protein n=1 Tax=Hypoxylon trugodes TaxID=326681 RepID=UPI00219945EE|nr:uncharacterized protein F4822DRAFT_406953 [Hypoxylon trugodes]KAI1387570.1 hypothetical protein F4822DRAFT_406953 [Hypoxylon trugodes]
MSTISSNSDISTMLYVFSAIFGLIPTIAVALRFQVRRRIQSSFKWDDWVILFALLSCITMAISIVVGTAAGGMGRPLRRDIYGNPIYDHQYVIYQKINYVIDLAQLLALGPTKVSVLLLYRRIFGIDKRRFNVISGLLITMVIAWTIVFFFTNAFQKTPVSEVWAEKPSENFGTFANTTDMYLAQSYIDVVLDVLIITLPVPLIWKLQMSWKRKLQISAVFLLGTITTGASIARTVVQYGVAKEFDAHNVDTTYYVVPVAYWPLIEAALGIVAACLPLLRPVGQIYSLGDLVLVSSEMMSSVFRVSSRDSRKSNRGHTNQSESGDRAATGYGDTPGDDKWLKIYSTSLLQQTVDNETHIESQIVPPPSVHSAPGDGIRCEKGYKVVYGPD